MPSPPRRHRPYWATCILASLLLLPGAARAQECDANSIPRVSGVAPALVYEGIATQLTVSGIFAVFPDTQAECLFWQAGVLEGRSAATSVSSSTIRCPLPLTLPVSDTDLVIKVFRSSATDPNSDFCYSDEQAPFFDPGDFARFGVQTVECRPATIPRISGVSPGLVGEGQLIDLTIAGIFDAFPDTQAACIFFQEGTAGVASSASSVSAGNLVCPFPVSLPPGSTDVVVQVFRPSASEPLQLLCFSHQLQDEAKPGDSARFEIEPAAVECQPRTVPRISGVSPVLVTEGEMGEVTVAGSYAVFSDTVGACVFWQGGLVVFTEPALTVSASEISCPLPALPLGETQVTVSVLRSGALDPGLSFCQSNEGSAVFDPGDSASLTVSAADCADLDGDGVCDGIDNCPRTYNPAQLDLGGMDGGVADGVGDLCQNGDWNQDGRVDMLDVTLERRRLVDLEPDIHPAMPPEP